MIKWLSLLPAIGQTDPFGNPIDDYK